MSKKEVAVKGSVVGDMAAEVRRMAAELRTAGAAELKAALDDLEAAKREMLARVDEAARAVRRCLDDVRAKVAAVASGLGAPAEAAKPAANRRDEQRPKAKAKPKRKAGPAADAAGLGGVPPRAESTPADDPAPVPPAFGAGGIAHDDGVPPPPEASDAGWAGGGTRQQTFTDAGAYFGEPFTVRRDACAAALRAGEAGGDRELSLRFCLSERVIAEIRREAARALKQGAA